MTKTFPLEIDFRNKSSIVGIIAGNGDLPWLVAENCVRNGNKCYIAFIGSNLPENLPLILENNPDLYEVRHFAIGKVGAMLEYFQSFGVKNLVLAGGVGRPNLSQIAVDNIGAALLGKILKNKFLGDDNILKLVANFLEERGFVMIAASEMMNSNARSCRTIALEDVPSDIREDIALGHNVLKALGKFDIGQSIIVHKRYVLGIEAAEGTDNLIKRCAELRGENKGGVLVKMMKSAQDLRFDEPSIGPETIKLLSEHGFQAIAIDSSVVVINGQILEQMASKLQILICNLE